MVKMLDGRQRGGKKGGENRKQQQAKGTRKVLLSEFQRDRK